MSLVNDMLHDLDARQDGDRNLQENNSEAVAQSNFSIENAKPYMLSVVVFVVIFWVAMFFKDTVSLEKMKIDGALASVSTSEPAPINTSVPKTVVVNYQVVDTLQETQAANTAQAIDAKTIVNVEAREVIADPLMLNNDEQKDDGVQTHDKDIARYLLLAAKALDNDRLTTPVSDSAYLYYQKILTLEPENKAALEGLQTISNRYISLASKSIEKGNNNRARRWLRKAEGVTPNRIEIAALMDVLNENSRVAKKTAIPVYNEEKFVVDSESVNALSTEKPAPKQTDKTALEPSPELSQETIVVTLASRDRVLSEQMQRKVATGDTAEIKRKLKHFLQESQTRDFAAPASRRLLFSVYLSQGLREKANALIVPNVSKSLSAYFQAKLYMFDGNMLSAIKALESQPQAILENEEYGAFTAGIYHRLERFADAEIIYKGLLENFDYKARYWLGLGLSFDQQKKYAQAVKAYQRIAYSAGATDVMISFSNKRIQELNT